jgi:TRAP-type mannitol/chloroaromatic compound transport system permease small subunit
MKNALGFVVLLFGAALIVVGFRTKRFHADGVLHFLSNESGELPRWWGWFSYCLVGGAFITAGICILLAPN